MPHWRAVRPLAVLLLHAVQMAARPLFAFRPLAVLSLHAVQMAAWPLIASPPLLLMVALLLPSLAALPLP